MLLWTLVYMSFCKHKQPFLLEIDIQMKLLSTVYMYFSHLIDKWQTSFQWLYQSTFHLLNNVTHIWCIYPLHFNPCNGDMVNPNFLVHVSMMANGTWHIFTCFWAIYLHCFVKSQFKVLAVCVCVCVCAQARMGECVVIGRGFSLFLCIISCILLLCWICIGNIFYFLVYFSLS